MTSLETPDYADMLARMLRAYGRRLSRANPEDLATAVRLHQEFGEILRAAGGDLLEIYSGAQLAEELQVSRQAVLKRFSRLG